MLPPVTNEWQREAGSKPLQSSDGVNVGLSIDPFHVHPAPLGALTSNG